MFKSAYVIDAEILIVDGVNPRALLAGKVESGDDKYYQFGQANLERIDGQGDIDEVLYNDASIDLYQGHRSLEYSIRGSGYAEDLIIALANFVLQDGGYIGLFPISSNSSFDAIRSYANLLTSKRLNAKRVICMKENYVNNLYLYECDTSILPKYLFRETSICRAEDEKTLPMQVLKYHDFRRAVFSAGLLITGGAGISSIPTRLISEQEANSIERRAFNASILGFDIDPKAEERANKFRKRLEDIEKIRKLQ